MGRLVAGERAQALGAQLTAYREGLAEFLTDEAVPFPERVGIFAGRASSYHLLNRALSALGKAGTGELILAKVSRGMMVGKLDHDSPWLIRRVPQPVFPWTEQLPDDVELFANFARARSVAPEHEVGGVGYGGGGRERVTGPHVAKPSNLQVAINLAPYPEGCENFGWRLGDVPTQLAVGDLAMMKMVTASTEGQLPEVADALRTAVLRAAGELNTEEAAGIGR